MISFKEFTVEMTDNDVSKPTYWRGVIYQNDFLDQGVEHQGFIEQAQSTLQQFCQGDYKSVDLDLKKSAGSQRLFSLRVNQENRILFMTVEVAGQPYALLLDVVLAHDYQKSHLNHPRKLNHLIMQAQTLASDPDFVRLTQTGSEISTPELDEDLMLTEQSAGLYYHQRRFVRLNPEQQLALNNDMPCILYGLAGSGKTLVMLTKMDQLLHELSQLTDPCELVYVTKTQALADSAASMFRELTSHTESHHKVVFIAYETWMLERKAGLRQQMVPSSNLKDWVSQYTKKSTRLAKKLPRAPYEFIRQAFELFAGRDIEKIAERDYKTLDNTIALEDYKTLWGEYHQSLNGKSKSELKFDLQYSEFSRAELGYNGDQEKRFLFVDEAQLFNAAQLKHLNYLSQYSMWNIDTHQILDTNHVNTDFLINHIKQYHLHTQDCKKLYLPNTYRCPTEVVEMLNRLVKAKYAITHGRAHLDEYVDVVQGQAEYQPGDIVWYTTSDMEKQDNSAEFVNGQAVVIINNEEFRSEAERLFGTKMVFTTHQIGGLAFSKVYAYRIFDSKILNDVSKQLGPYHEHSNSPKHRAAREDQELQKYNSHMNHLYVTLSRVERHLVIVQNENNKNQNLLSWAKGELTASSCAAAIAHEDAPEPEMPIDVESIRFKLKIMILSNQSSQARCLYDSSPELRVYLNQTYEDYVSGVLAEHNQSKAHAHRFFGHKVKEKLVETIIIDEQYVIKERAYALYLALKNKNNELVTLLLNAYVKIEINKSHVYAAVIFGDPDSLNQMMIENNTNEVDVMKLIWTSVRNNRFDLTELLFDYYKPYLNTSDEKSNGHPILMKALQLGAGSEFILRLLLLKSINDNINQTDSIKHPLDIGNKSPLDIAMKRWSIGQLDSHVIHCMLLHGAKPYHEQFKSWINLRAKWDKFLESERDLPHFQDFLKKYSQIESADDLTKQYYTQILAALTEDIQGQNREIKKNREVIIDNAGVTSVLISLLSRDNHINTIRLAAHALISLTVFNSEDRNDLPTAINPVISLLSTVNDIETQHHSALILANLSKYPENQDIIREKGGIPPLISLLSCNHITTIRSALAALLFLSKNNVANLQAILETKGGTALIGSLTMKYQAEDPVIFSLADDLAGRLDKLSSSTNNTFHYASKAHPRQRSDFWKAAPPIDDQETVVEIQAHNKASL